MGALCMDMKDYSILLRDRISPAEWQEDVTLLQRMCVSDPELARCTADLHDASNKMRKACPFALLCICLICCLLPYSNKLNQRALQAHAGLTQRTAQLAEAFVAQLSAKYADRGVLMRYRSDKQLAGVSVHAAGRTVSSRNTYKVAQWVAIEMAELDGAEKAAIKERAAQMGQAASARAAAGVMLPVPVVPVMGNASIVQVMPAPRAL